MAQFNKSTSTGFSTNCILISDSNLQKKVVAQFLSEQLRSAKTENPDSFTNSVAFFLQKLLCHFHLGSNYQTFREDLLLPKSSGVQAELLSCSGVGAKTLFPPIFRFYQLAVRGILSRFVEDLKMLLSFEDLDSMFIACCLLNSKAYCRLHRRICRIPNISLVAF